MSADLKVAYVIVLLLDPLMLYYVWLLMSPDFVWGAIVGLAVSNAQIAMCAAGYVVAGRGPAARRHHRLFFAAHAAVSVVGMIRQGIP